MAKKKTRGKRAAATEAAAITNVHSELAQLVRALATQYGSTNADFARRAKVSTSQLSHWMNPARTERGPNVAACVRLAHAGKCSLARVLRAAGLQEYALMIEDLYGAAEQARRQFGARIIAAHELAHLTDWRKLTPAEHKIYSTLIKHAHVARARTGHEPVDEPLKKEPA